MTTNTSNSNTGYEGALKKALAKYSSVVNKAVQDGKFDDVFEAIYDYYNEKTAINIKYGRWQNDRGLDFTSILYIANDLMAGGKFSFGGDIKELFDSFYKSHSDNNDDFLLSDCGHFAEKYHNEPFDGLDDINKFAGMITRWIKFKERVRIDIIEPHPDDALGSASAFL